MLKSQHNGGKQMVAFIVILGTLVVIGVIAYAMVKKRKGEAWQGIVTDKSSREVDSDNGSSTYYYLHVKLDDGGQKKMQLSKKLWDSYAVGDKVVKNAGQYNPSKA